MTLLNVLQFRKVSLWNRTAPAPVLSRAAHASVSSRRPRIARPSHQCTEPSRLLHSKGQTSHVRPGPTSLNTCHPTQALSSGHATRHRPAVPRRAPCACSTPGGPRAPITLPRVARTRCPSCFESQSGRPVLILFPARRRLCPRKQPLAAPSWQAVPHLHLPVLVLPCSSLDPARSLQAHQAAPSPAYGVPQRTRRGNPPPATSTPPADLSPPSASTYTKNRPQVSSAHPYPSPR
jgi:hypothetical protein